jgi:hypothetical protein
MDPPVNIPDFTYMVVCIVTRDRYYPVSYRIIPVTVFRIHDPVIMVHTVGPGDIYPVWYTIMVIDLPVPDGIVMIAFYMIRAYHLPVGCCIMFTMLCMGPGNRLTAAGIATNRMIISVVTG